MNEEELGEEIKERGYLDFNHHYKKKSHKDKKKC